MDLGRIALLGALRARLPKGLRRRRSVRRGRDCYRRTNSQYEPLEPRLVLSHAEPDVISVGRVLSSWSASNITDGQLKITYSVYNQQAENVAGVLLTTTLQPGVTFVGASPLPDRLGQELAWSLGTLDPFGRASVEVTVALASPMVLTVDDGAQAFGTRSARMVTDEAHPATLRAAPIDPDLLRSTPDANTTDPFILAKAAELNQDAAEIIEYLKQDVAYESYVGSLRGARGTLWSSAGNALDEASLGIALLRSSGIPARYAEGTLPDHLARALILSMFPEPFQVVGYIPPGTEVADPANDPQLLAETREHYWIQFDAGTGFADIDTTFAVAQLGQTFTSSARTFREVPEALRHEVQVKLNAEIYSQAFAAFGIGSGLSTTTVLDHTFNTVELVGRPVSIGHFVQSQFQGALIVAATTNTYSPYIALADVAFDSNTDEIIRGSDYQETVNNIFALATEVLSGLFLQIETRRPDGSLETLERALVDRVGYATRQAGGGRVTLQPNEPPAFSELDLFTLNILPSRYSAAAAQLLLRRANQEIDTLLSEATPTTAIQRRMLIALARAKLARFAVASDEQAADFARGFSVAAYSTLPRVAMFTTRMVTADDHSTISFSVDLINDVLSAIASPGQSVQASLAFAAARGVFDSYLESASLPASPGIANLSAVAVFEQSIQQRIPLIAIGESNLSIVSTLEISPDAVARITRNVRDGLTVIVPTKALSIGNTRTTAWFNLDPVTGEVIAEREDGSHGALFEYFALNVVLLVPPLISFLLGAAALSVANSDPAAAATLASASTGFATLQGFVPVLGLVYTILNTVFAEFLILAAEYYALKKMDPPLPNAVFGLPRQFPIERASEQLVFQSQRAPGLTENAVHTESLTTAGVLSVYWSTLATSYFMGRSLESLAATVHDSMGSVIGTGGVTLNSTDPLPVVVTVSGAVNINGIGSIAFYAPATSTYGVAGNWEHYAADLNGDVTITLTSDALTLNGRLLPPGTYTITTDAGTLTGSGATASPNFAGSVAITSSGAIVEVGRGTGNVTIGGNAQPTDTGFTLGRFNGTVNITAGGAAHTVDLAGNADQVLRVAGSPAAITGDQNTSAVFRFDVETSLADTYTLTARAPDGWTVTIDDNGQVTVTPKPGTQSGDHVVRLVARSQSNPDLVAAADVTVTVTPTLPGLEFDVAVDPVFTVPFFGAQVPTAFRATIQNLGPDADTYELTFPSPPAGFNILRSLDRVTVPAGETGIVGVYLEPNGQIPPPGTPVSFTVVATSVSDPTITETRTFTFSMPQVAAVSVESDPLTLAGLPGAPVTAELTLTNAGNVPYNIGVGATLPGGLALSGVTTPVTLAVGQSTTQLLTFTPAAGTPLNSTLSPTLTFGPAVASDRVSVVGVALDQTFIEAGQTVNVSASIFGALTAPRENAASFVLKDPDGNLVWQSTQVPLDLSNVPTARTLDLGPLETSGLAPGGYTIETVITDANNDPIPGATGQATLVVGLPISANQEVTPQTLNEGLELTYVTHESTVTSTINVSTQPLVGSVATAGTARTIAVIGSLAYVAGTDDITIVDLADPANPRIVRTFGTGELTQGGVNIARLAGNRLIVATQSALNSTSTKFLVYDLADSQSPQLAGTAIVPYSFLGEMLVQGSTVLGTMSTISFALPGTILGQFGDFLSVDVTNSASPALADVLFNDLGQPRGGRNNISGGTAVAGQLAYLGSTTSTGTSPRDGVGRLLVVNTADPANLSLVREVQVPGTVQVGPVAVQGNRALLGGTTGGWRNPFNGFLDIGLDGNVTLTLLDTSDPRNPQVLGTTVTSAVLPRGSAFAKNEIVALGDNRFAVGGVETEEDGPVILIVDANNPANVVVRNLAVPAQVNGMAVAGGLLHTTSAAGIDTYRIAAITEQPVHVEVRVPTGMGAEIVPNSFSLAPTQIIAGAAFDTLVWDLTFDAARSSQELSWDTAITGLTPGTTREVMLGATVQLGAAGGGDDLTLPPLVVAAVPATQSLVIPIRIVVPGADAIADASIAAGQLGEPDLANRLSDLAIALTNLVQTPTSDIFKSQATTSIEAVARIVAADPRFDTFAEPLVAERDGLRAATTPEEIQTAVRSLGDVLDDFRVVVVNHSRHDFELFLLDNRVVALPQTPARFELGVHNIGTGTTVYDVQVTGLPPGVTAEISEPAITLGRDELRTVFVTLTQMSDEELLVGEFSIVVTADGVSPPLVRTAIASLAARREFLSVPSVDADPPFVEPGGQVDVSARLLNVVNRRQQAVVSFVLKDASGQTAFTSTPAAVAFDLTASLKTVDLGPVDTTSLARGTYSIEVTVANAEGEPIPGGTGRGTLLVGLPVSASITVEPQLVPPGTSTVTNTLHVDARSTTDGLALIGQVQTSILSTSIAIRGDLAYVAGTNGIDIVDVSNAAQPVVLSTFGRTDLGAIGNAFIRIQGDVLFVGATANRNANRFVLLTYSLATDPLDPLLLSSRSINYHFISDIIVHGDTILAPTFGYAFTFGGNILGQFGDVLSVDISDRAAPALADVLFSSRPAPNGGNTPQFGGAIVNDEVAYVSSTTSSGAAFQTGQGRVLVVDYSDATNLSLVTDVIIPGTYITFDVAIDGNRALVVGNSGASVSPGGGYAGQITLSMLDISDPLNPRPIGTTLETDGHWRIASTAFAEPLGGGRFVVTATLEDNSRALLLVDASDPNNIGVTNIEVPQLVNELAVAGNLLYTTSAAGLLVYDLGAVVDVSVTASVQVPNGTGVALVPDSFSAPPTRIVAGADFDTLVWDLTLTGAAPQRTITWQSTVTGMQPGTSRMVTLDTVVDFVSQGSPGQLTLPPASVTAEQVLSLDPPSRTARPGEAVGYTVTIANPAQTDVTYDLSVMGVPADWVGFQSQVTVTSGQSVDLDLTLTSSPIANEGDYTFVVVATTGGVQGTVAGTLTLVGDPILPDIDPQSHGVVLTLTPLQRTAGQGTAARYTARITNTGSATETFALSTQLLPTEFSITFGQDAITVPPGASNFREVPLVIIPPAGTISRPYVFGVRAVSTTDEGVADVTTAILNVVAGGVDVQFMPQSGRPNSTFDLLVTNTGSVADTYHVAVAAPAALVAQLGMTSVTLLPGQSRMVPVQVGGIDFAFPGALPLVGVAMSSTNSSVMDADEADVLIDGILGVAAELVPDAVELPAPGMASLLLLVDNIGNLEDAYSATIVTSGPLEARLTDLDGRLVTTVPLFRLPGLATGAILVQANLTGFGTGTITVLIQSLTEESITAEATATIRAVSESQTSSIVGLSYVDNNNNGQFDPRELTLLGTPIVLLDGSGNTVAATFSNLEGVFRFDGLAAGTYTVRKVQPPLFIDGKDTPGSLGDADNVANQFTINLPPSTSAVDYLFGERGLLPQYIGKSPYLSSTPANLWENLNLSLTDLWHAFEPDSPELQAVIEYAAANGSVSVQVFNERMQPLQLRDAAGEPAMRWRVTPGERHYLRLSGTNNNVDLALTESGTLEIPPLSGDLDGSGMVDQRDLDLVLLNWGKDGAELESTWRRSRPTGRVGQHALDEVLLNWGRQNG